MLDPNTWLRWAQYYASLGYAVLPLAGKVPVTPRGVHDASTDPAQHAEWVRRFPGANIGVAIPAGKAVIDVDPRNGGEATIDALEAQHGRLPLLDLPVAETGSGGWHAWLDLPPDAALPGRLGPGVDVKQLGGYVVASPSIHPDTGRPYRWIGEGLETPRRVGTPAWLLAQARPRSVSRVAATDHDARLDNMRFGMNPDRAISDVPDEAIVDALRAVEPLYQPGQRHHVRVKMGALLNRLGWSRDSIERFGYGLHAAYGGDNAAKIARETVMGMSYPSGYYDLVAMAPPGYRDAIAKSLDAIHNPFGAEYRAANARAAAELRAAFGEPQALPPTTPAPVAAGLVTPLQQGQPSAGVVGPIPVVEAIAQQVNSLAALGKPVDVHAPLPPIEYVVEGLPWHFDAVNAVVGFANSGKSPFAASMIVALNAGIPWQGRATRKGRVLVLAFEGARSLLRHIQRHARAVCAPISNVDFVECNAGALVDDPTYVLNLRRIAAGYQYVVIDTYNGAAASAEIRDTKFALAAKQLEIEGVCTILVLHTTKDDETAPTLRSIAGTGALAGAIKAAVGLWRPKDCNDGYTFECVCVRTPDKPFEPFRYRVADSAEGWLLEPVAVPERDGDDDPGETKVQTVARYVNAIPTLFEGKPPMHRVTLFEIKAELRAQDTDLIRKATNELEALGILVRASGRGRSLGWTCRGTPRDHHDGGVMPVAPVVARSGPAGSDTAPVLPAGPGFDPALIHPPPE